jgi:hypothetical protein
MVQLSHLTCSVGSLEYGWIKELLPKFGLQLDRDVTFLPIGPTATRFTALKNRDRRRSAGCPTTSGELKVCLFLIGALCSRYGLQGRST